MQTLTPQGEQLANNISSRYGLSYQSAVQMIIAVNNGGGTMAQFSVPELGSGQWMKGGMTMVSDMFNYALKTTVVNLCEEISNALATTQIFPPVQTGVPGSNNWWPAEFGVPSSVGAQNNVRYAVFPQSRRLVVQRGDQISVFDTLDHNIGGVSQQQGGGDSLTFSSQYGTIAVSNLPRISGPAAPEPPQTNFAVQQPPAPVSAPPQSTQSSPAPEPQKSAGQSPADLVTLLEKLGQLRDAGVLTDDEFTAKKTDLLSRL